MKREAGISTAFDKVLELFEEDIEASGDLASEVIPVQHIREFIGQILHDIDTGDGSIKFEFFRDVNGNDQVGEISDTLDDTIHDIYIKNFADYVKITIHSDDDEAKTVTAMIAGHYIPLRD